MKSKTQRQRFKRALLLPGRYGVSEKKFLRRLEDMVALLKRHGVVGTFPTTATVLERHPAIAKILDGMELAIHGYNHRDMSGVEKDRQESMIREAIEIFRSFNLEVNGFRAPYLRWSDSTLDAVAGVGLLYDSSIPVAWRCGKDVDSATLLKDALASYGVGEVGTHFPAIRGNLVEMPVAVPDDEILIDRVDVSATDRLTKALMAMTDSAVLSGGHLVLQLHPERFHIFGNALDDVLKHALEQRIWIASLGEVAKWWKEKTASGPAWSEGARCTLTISGDIDAVTLGDFIVRRFGR